MPATIERETMSPPLERAVPTRADIQSSISPTAAGIIRQGWNPVIDDILLSWLRNPRQLADDGVEPPSSSVLRLALDFAEKFRDELFLAPDRVSVDPNGGIVFEKLDGPVVHEIHIWDDGTVEYMRFNGSTLVLRKPY